MFNNPVRADSNIDEGDVVQVDVNRSVCKIKTVSGQNLDGVKWLQPVGGASRAGDRVCPTLGDRVVVQHGLGYPLIIGFMPRIQTSDNKFPLVIDSGNVLVDTGDYTAGGTNAAADQNKPKDMLVGDRVLASIGGGMIAMLRAGSVLLRSSRLSEIFLSKWDDLVRIVSRNWEQFTDLSTDIVKNLRGRVYRYTGYATSQANGQIEAYQYHLYYGDTALAEAVKSAYQTASNPPTPNTIIFKEQVTPAGGAELMHRTLDISGNEEVWITTGGFFTRMKATGGQLTFSWGDQNTITVNQTMIQHNFNNKQIITIDGNQIDLKHNGGAEITMDANGIRSVFQGGEVNQSSSSVSTTYSSHFVTVDSGGVHLG